MRRKQGRVGNAVCHVYLLILTSIAVFPLLWIFISSIKGKGELTGNPTGSPVNLFDSLCSYAFSHIRYEKDLCLDSIWAQGIPWKRMIACSQLNKIFILFN